MTSTPPIKATTRMTTSRLAKVADLRSSWMPPITATAVYSGGTTHAPRRLTPLIKAHDW